MSGARKRGRLQGFLLILVVLVGCATAPRETAPDPQSFTLMTLNVRYDDIEEVGPTSWEARSVILGKLLAKEKPDLICLQEVASAEG
jgi:mRNA deadenylase 3'-5' endonuclease subunit Ccr4